MEAILTCFLCDQPKRLPFACVIRYTEEREKVDQPPV